MPWYKSAVRTIGRSPDDAKTGGTACPTKALCKVGRTVSSAFFKNSQNSLSQKNTCFDVLIRACKIAEENTLEDF